jgi:hypothetical protein
VKIFAFSLNKRTYIKDDEDTIQTHRAGEEHPQLGTISPPDVQAAATTMSRPTAGNSQLVPHFGTTSQASRVCIIHTSYTFL